MPRYSIILPVYNGGEFVKECLQSILRQSFTDFEVLVLDNCSNDGTSEWLRGIGDTRVKVFRSDRFLTIEENWKRIRELKKSEYMTMIGHDDRLGENYLAVMDDLVKTKPFGTLYQAHFVYIDSKGNTIRDCKHMPSSLDMACFLRKFLKNEIDVMGTGFMMRSLDYDKLGGIPDYPNLLFADFELWINLIRKGSLEISPEKCFVFRLHQSTTTASGDVKFLNAFERFSTFLKSLEEDPKVLSIVKSDGPAFLRFYCRGLSHRLLRTPLKNRNNLRVKNVVQTFRDIAQSLGVTAFDPSSQTSIRLAVAIDSTAPGRSLFLFFKRIFKRPVLN